MRNYSLVRPVCEGVKWELRVNKGKLWYQKENNHLESLQVHVLAYIFWRKATNEFWTKGRMLMMIKEVTITGITRKPFFHEKLSQGWKLLEFLGFQGLKISYQFLIFAIFGYFKTKFEESCLFLVPCMKSFLGVRSPFIFLNFWPL